MRRSTWRGSGAQAASRRKFWGQVVLNATCMLLFAGFVIGAIFLALDRLAS